MKTTTQRQGQRGFALAAVFLVLLLASGITAAIHAGVLGDTFASGAHHRATSAFYAAESGIKNGDAILSVNGVRIADSRDLALQIACFAPNTLVYVKVLRGQK